MESETYTGSAPQSVMPIQRPIIVHVDMSKHRILREGPVKSPEGSQIPCIIHRDAIAATRYKVRGCSPPLVLMVRSQIIPQPPTSKHTTHPFKHLACLTPDQAYFTTGAPIRGPQKPHR